MTFLIAATIVTMVTIYYVWSWIQSRRNIRDMRQRHVLITGCDTGFGNLLARTLDSMGISVFAGCLTEQGRASLEAHCSSRLRALLLDVTNDTSVKMTVENVENILKGDQVQASTLPLCRIVGTCEQCRDWTSGMPFEILDHKSERRVIEVNLFGAWRVTRAFLPLVRKAKGRIVNMSSGVGFCAVPGGVPYCASKAALEAFSDCLRRELYRSGVTVHIVQPGAFKTNIGDEVYRAGEEFLQSADPSVKEYYSGNIIKYINKLKDDFRHGSDTDLMKVVSAQKHALFSTRPRNRYRAGGLDITMTWLMCLLPEWVMDPMLGWPQPGQDEKEVFSWMSFVLRK